MLHRAAGPRVATRIVASVATWCAFVLFAAVAVLWGWRWFGPAPVAMPAGASVTPLERFAMYPPFGAPRRASDTPAPAAEPLVGDARLLGVLAEPGGGGRALFRMPDGTPHLVEAGAALSRDTLLVAVRPDGVTLRDAGGERAIALRGQRTEVARAAPKRAASTACAVPAGYKGPVVRLNAELVAGLIAQPEGLRAIAEARDGALVIRDESGFAALVGMKKGDRVTQANGIALRAPEDVIIAILRPLAASQSVRLSGSRGSEVRELYIVNAGTCPG